MAIKPCIIPHITFIVGVAELESAILLFPKQTDYQLSHTPIFTSQYVKEHNKKSPILSIEAYFLYFKFYLFHPKHIYNKPTKVSPVG